MLVSCQSPLLHKHPHLFLVSTAIEMCTWRLPGNNKKWNNCSMKDVQNSLQFNTTDKNYAIFLHKRPMSI